MTARPDITALAAAIGEPARGKMLSALMDGRALTATELSLDAEVSPSTASSHLAKLQRAGLIAVASQGRHRYFRIASEEIATLLEQLMGLAAIATPRRFGPSDPALRHARVCYDHLAGESGVQLWQQLKHQGLATNEALTRKGEAWANNHHLALNPKRPPLRLCLDWSERRDHVAGALGAAILDHLFAKRWAKRDLSTRALKLTPRGELFLRTLS